MVLGISTVLVHIDTRISKSNLEYERAVKLISFCIDCPSPEDEGSVAYGLISRYLYASKQDYVVTGQLVYCVPNLADGPSILNKHQFPGRIVLVDRGKISLHEKIFRLQQAGAEAILVGDDGQCDEAFTYCGARMGSALEGGFAAFGKRYLGFVGEYRRLKTKHYYFQKIVSFFDAFYIILNYFPLSPFTLTPIFYFLCCLVFVFDPCRTDGMEVWQQLSVPVYLVSKRSAERFKSMMTIRAMDIPGAGWQNVSIVAGANGDEL